MESLTKPISLMEISYPVFRLGNEKPLVEDGVVLYLSRIRDEDSSEIRTTYKIIDDQNVPGDSLAARRLRLLSDSVPLKKLSVAIFFLGDLIKLAKSSTWFIDSMGNVFRYLKSTRVVLEIKRITRTILIPSGGAIIEVEGLPSRFKCMYKPAADEKYAGIIKYGLSYILYGFYTEKLDNTWRLI